MPGADEVINVTAADGSSAYVDRSTGKPTTRPDNWDEPETRLRREKEALQGAYFAGRGSYRKRVLAARRVHLVAAVIGLLAFGSGALRMRFFPDPSWWDAPLNLIAGYAVGLVCIGVAIFLVYALEEPSA